MRIITTYRQSLSMSVIYPFIHRLLSFNFPTELIFKPRLFTFFTDIHISFFHRHKVTINLYSFSDHGVMKNVL